MLQMRALVGLGLITGLIFNILSFFAINFYSFLSTIPVVGSMMELGLIIPAYYFFPHGIASLISVAGYVAYLRMAREKENDR